MKKHEGRKICDYLAYLLVKALDEETDFLSKADIIVHEIMALKLLRSEEFKTEPWSAKNRFEHWEIR